MKSRIKEITHKSGLKTYAVEVHRMLWYWEKIYEFLDKESAIAYAERVNKRYEDSIILKETILN